MSVIAPPRPTVDLRVNQTHTVIADNVPVRLTITRLTLWDATFTVTGPGVRNPEKPRTMPVAALACWLELAKKGLKSNEPAVEGRISRPRHPAAGA
jgi:hypothetical protein